MDPVFLRAYLLLVSQGGKGPSDSRVMHILIVFDRFSGCGACATRMIFRGGLQGLERLPAGGTFVSGPMDEGPPGKVRHHGSGDELSERNKQMIEPLRRGHLRQPSGQLHRTIFDITSVGLHRARGGQAVIRLSALLAAFVLVWCLVTDTAVDAAESAFIATMLGFAWHVEVRITWNSGR